ncbi:AcrR family transcriptional regulator [Microbacteriaceae bacterium SG_E_30_P1]|uniref:AcrR family transcriptional regulator n=1 Tax=Antiquaquibacter oligotrophicus TaxID=2880260 RepID=A0ABT6KME6_9MICO|nr:TetR/AcrR family transcriptional regulator C-terminal domain-containing protein [Antiquaquibacter oligotrophicus]MDH6180302.1 AcrR family transcriptional regulator [Antiquaquibacter oligotrophicus]UDF13951.1 TetR/AcrR family transcriptional regulator C-terminal domain-containing protein [Antiquaquibacter oligotrophicus]
MGRPTAPLITPELIADAALQLIDAQRGQFTLTQIARTLGVKGPSLYNHVSGREDVLELVRKRIHLSVNAELRAEWSWQDSVRHVARSDRDSIGQHPWIAAEFMISSMAATEPLDAVARFAEKLEAAGFASVDVLKIITSIDLLAIGSALDINAPDDIYGPDAIEADTALGRALRANRSGKARADEAFEFALDRLVESLELLLERTRSDQHPA